MILYCVRHAESIYNSEGRIQGQSDPPLSADGRRQAEAIAAGFESISLDAIFASPLQRAHDSARPLAEASGLKIQLDPRLMELNAGVFQDKLWDDIEREFPEDAARWAEQDPDFTIPEGESRRDLMKRGHAALESIRDAGYARAAVVAHGGTLSAAFKSLLGIPAERNPLSLLNASISQLHWPDGQEHVRLVTLNQIEHLRRAGCETRGGDL